MQSGADLIDRFLAAHEGGLEVPEDVMAWLANGFREFKRRPAMGLDKAFNYETPTKGECKREVRKHLRLHFSKYERPLNRSRNRAAEHMAHELQLLARNYDDLNVAPQYRLLFDKISGLGERMPGDELIKKILRKI